MDAYSQTSTTSCHRNSTQASETLIYEARYLQTVPGTAVGPAGPVAPNLSSNNETAIQLGTLRCMHLRMHDKPLVSSTVRMASSRENFMINAGTGAGQN